MNLLQVFDEHHVPLFRFAYRLTGSVADAEDIVQACFLELLRPDCSYDPARGPLRTWLFGVVRNQSLKRLRLKTTPPVPGTHDASSPENDILRKAQAGAKSYFIRYAVMNGATPGAWTTIAAATIQKPITISGLTPATIYGFQVQALGVLGYSDWSPITTIICI